MSGTALTRPIRRFVTRHPHPLVLLDIAVAVLLLVGLIMADARSGLHDAAAAESAVRAGGIALASLSVAVRRLRPRWSFAVATLCTFAVTAVGGAPQVSVCVAVTAYTVAEAGEFVFWWARPGAASLLTAAGIGIGRVASSWEAVLMADVAIICAGWFAGLAAREHRKRLAAIAEQRTERERQHAAAIRQAAIDERLVIARELHDIVAHSMSVIAVRAGVARMVMNSDPGQARETLGIVETTTRQALHEMRLLVQVLRHEHAVDPALAPTPGLDDIAALADQVRCAGVDLSLDIIGTPRPLPPGVDLSAYRIAQEALTNVVRHAGPVPASLRIEYRDEDVKIEVTNSAPPEPRRTGKTTIHAVIHPDIHTVVNFHPTTDPDPEPSEHSRASAGHGLIGMRERAALYGGYLRADRHGDGFRVQALLRTDESSPMTNRPAPPDDGASAAAPSRQPARSFSVPIPAGSDSDSEIEPDSDSGSAHGGRS
ncbi:sensor histidine kinase [Actinomadura terrae]|uniref:sensor histidine kinase n=1 Tax=Actinomadura terrae TaxID=604353 RepID=UPI001FA6B80E|nr:histidine kinase [Actinomadura terrae]